MRRTRTTLVVTAGSLGLLIAAPSSGSPAVGQLTIAGVVSTPAPRAHVEFGVPGDFVQRRDPAGNPQAGQYVSTRYLNVGFVCDTTLSVQELSVARPVRVYLTSNGKLRIDTPDGLDRAALLDVRRRGRTIQPGGRWYQATPTVLTGPPAAGDPVTAMAYDGAPLVRGAAVLPATKLSARYSSVLLLASASASIRQVSGAPVTNAPAEQVAACAEVARTTAGTIVRRVIRNAKVARGSFAAGT